MNRIHTDRKGNQSLRFSKIIALRSKVLCRETVFRSAGRREKRFFGSIRSVSSPDASALPASSGRGGPWLAVLSVEGEGRFVRYGIPAALQTCRDEPPEKRPANGPCASEADELSFPESFSRRYASGSRGAVGDCRPAVASALHHPPPTRRAATVGKCRVDTCPIAAFFGAACRALCIRRPVPIRSARDPEKGGCCLSIYVSHPRRKSGTGATRMGGTVNRPRIIYG